MEKYKKQLIWCSVRMALLGLLLIAIFFLFSPPVFSGNLLHITQSVSDEMAGLRLGVISGFTFGMLVYIVRNIYLLHNPKKLEEAYIRMNDERERLIKEKTGSATCIMTMYLLVLGMTISASYNIVVCHTLLVITYGMLFIYAGCTIYFRRKY